MVDLDKIDINIDEISYVRVGEKNIPWKYDSTSEVFYDKPLYTLTYIKNGGISSKYGNETVEFKVGSMYFGTRPKIQYTNSSMELPTVIYVITFFTEEEIPLEFYPDGRLKVYPSNPVLIEKLYAEALDLFIKKPVAWKISLKQITLKLLAEFLQALHAKRLNITMPAFLIDSLRYIESNLFYETININELAKRSNVSTTHFLRVFKQEFGVSPKKYINRLKIESASVLLINTDHTIQEVCEQSGFNDIAYFNRCFKSETGFSPSQFRKTNKIHII